MTNTAFYETTTEKFTVVLDLDGHLTWQYPDGGEYIYLFVTGKRFRAKDFWVGAAIHVTTTTTLLSPSVPTTHLGDDT